MKTISPEAREAAARFWDFLGQHGSANMIRNGTGFRTTAEVFAEFEEEIRAKVASEIVFLNERNDALALQFDELSGKYQIVSEMNAELREKST